MIRHPLILAAALIAALTLGATCASAASIPDNIAAAVADGARPVASLEPLGASAATAAMPTDSSAALRAMNFAIGCIGLSDA